MQSWKKSLVIMGVLMTILEVSQGFFLPSSWTSGFDNPTPPQRKQPDTAKQWQPQYSYRDYPYFQQQYSYDAPQAMPMAISYPMAMAPQSQSQSQLQHQQQPQQSYQPQQISMQGPSQMSPLPPASFHVAPMQLVPCLCSVPTKEDAQENEPNSLLVQNSQKIST